MTGSSLKKPLNIFLTSLFAIALVLGLGACSKSQDSPVQPTFGQSLQITIDGKVITMHPDNPTEGMVATSNFVQSYGTFNLTLFNKTENITFGVLGKIDKLAVGTYPVYECLDLGDECDDQNQYASLFPYPDENHQPTSEEIKQAYLSPELGLQPLTLTITEVQNATWPGVPGIVKRVKGTMKASLASVEKGPDNRNRVLGPLKQVEVTFDMYCRVL